MTEPATGHTDLDQRANRMTHMLSLDDCMGFCALSPDELEAIAAHEHVPLIVAAELGEDLLSSEAGVQSLAAMILDAARRAKSRGCPGITVRYVNAYRAFRRAHRQDF